MSAYKSKFLAFFYYNKKSQVFTIYSNFKIITMPGDKRLRKEFDLSPGGFCTQQRDEPIQCKPGPSILFFFFMQR